MRLWKSKRRAILIAAFILLTAIVSSAATWAFMRLSYADFYRELEAAKELENLPQFKKYLQVLAIIKSNFVAEVDTGKMVDGSISGLVNSLGDPFSYYMTSSSLEETMVHIQGTYYGIGMSVEQKDGYVVVVTPFRGTPAWDAGIQPGDKIIAVDGKNVVGIPADQVVQLIKGPEGTSVRLTLQREGVQELIEVSVVRKLITLPTVRSAMIDGFQIGYLQIAQFGANTAESVAKEVNSLRKQGMKGLIIDLRLNGGGLLEEAVKVAEYFVPRGPVVHVIDRRGRRETYNSNGEGAKYPIAVLVDNGTASAAEILAAAIRDRGVGKLVGSVTFGKASVQIIHKLEDGSGLRLTVARYVTPSEQIIDGKGLKPDVEVKAEVKHGSALHDSKIEWDKDPVIREAVKLLASSL